MLQDESSVVMLEIRDLVAGYGKSVVLKNLSLVVSPGRLWL